VMRYFRPELDAKLQPAVSPATQAAAH